MILTQRKKERRPFPYPIAVTCKLARAAKNNRQKTIKSETRRECALCMQHICLLMHARIDATTKQTTEKYEEGANDKPTWNA